MRGVVFAGMRSVAIVSLGSLSALHVAWAAGSAWPAADRIILADAVGGFRQPPGPVACLIVAKLLAVGACCVGGIPRGRPGLTRIGSALVILALSVRGGIGLTGRLPNSKRSAVFAALNRRVYSPVCLALALAATAGVLPPEPGA